MYMAKAAGKGSWRVSTRRGRRAEPRLGAAPRRRKMRSSSSTTSRWSPCVPGRSRPSKRSCDGTTQSAASSLRTRSSMRPRSGQIVQIDRWVLQEACRQVRTWKEHVPGAADLSVHVNLSATAAATTGMGRQRHARRCAHPAWLPSISSSRSPRPRWWPTPRRPRRELGSLRASNVRLALDDFGTGFSSLSHLFRLPVDVIKIDRSFVSGVGADDERSRFVQALVNLGRSLELQIVAEGIEEESELVYLRSIGCGQGQGFYFAEPCDAWGLETILRAGGLLGPGDGRETAHPAHPPLRHGPWSPPRPRSDPRRGPRAGPPPAEASTGSSTPERRRWSGRCSAGAARGARDPRHVEARRSRQARERLGALEDLVPRRRLGAGEVVRAEPLGERERQQALGEVAHVRRGADAVGESAGGLARRRAAGARRSGSRCRRRTRSRCGR